MQPMAVCLLNQCWRRARANNCICVELFDHAMNGCPEHVVFNMSCAAVKGTSVAQPGRGIFTKNRLRRRRTIFGVSARQARARTERAARTRLPSSCLTRPHNNLLGVVSTPPTEPAYSQPITNGAGHFFLHQPPPESDAGGGGSAIRSGKHQAWLPCCP